MRPPRQLAGRGALQIRAAGLAAAACRDKLSPSTAKTGQTMTRTLGLVLVLIALGGATLNAYASPAHHSTLASCSPNGKAVTIGGKAATVYCGPARATVRIGAQTMTFRNGTCVWTKNLFKLRMGTIFLFRGKPLQQQPGFSIYADARALIEVFWGGRYYYTSTLHATAHANSTRTGGTFKGRTGKGGTGPAISGTIRC
jgi:hypothetical protein